jgi:hypothetical protein
MRKLTLLALTLSVPVPAAASEPAAGQDQNEIVCRTENVIGSRLSRTRRCATRAAWAQMQQTERASTQNALRQGVQPQDMNPAEKARIAGRYYVRGQ